MLANFSAWAETEIFSSESLLRDRKTTRMSITFRIWRLGFGETHRWWCRRTQKWWFSKYSRNNSQRIARFPWNEPDGFTIRGREYASQNTIVSTGNHPTSSADPWKSETLWANKRQWRRIRWIPARYQLWCLFVLDEIIAKFEYNTLILCLQPQQNLYPGPLPSA